MEKKTLVLGVIGADCHAVGNKIMDYALTEAGFEVINIGVLSPQEDWDDVYSRFKAMGFNRVYPPGTSIDTTIHDLKEDLGIE